MASLSGELRGLSLDSLMVRHTGIGLAHRFSVTGTLREGPSQPHAPLFAANMNASFESIEENLWYGIRLSVPVVPEATLWLVADAARASHPCDWVSEVMTLFIKTNLVQTSH